MVATQTKITHSQDCIDQPKLAHDSQLSVSLAWRFPPVYSHSARQSGEASLELSDCSLRVSSLAPALPGWPPRAVEHEHRQDAFAQQGAQPEEECTQGRVSRPAEVSDQSKNRSAATEPGPAWEGRPNLRSDPPQIHFAHSLIRMKHPKWCINA